MWPASSENTKIYILNNTIVTNDDDVKYQFQRRKHDMVCPEHFLLKFFPSMATANCVFKFDGMDPNKRYISVRSQELSHRILLENSKNGIVDFEAFRDGVTMLGLGVGIGVAAWGMGIPILMRRLVRGKILPTGFKVLNPFFYCISAMHVAHLTALCRVQPMDDRRGMVASSTQIRIEHSVDVGQECAARTLGRKVQRSAILTARRAHTEHTAACAGGARFPAPCAVMRTGRPCAAARRLLRLCQPSAELLRWPPARPFRSSRFSSMPRVSRPDPAADPRPGGPLAPLRAFEPVFLHDRVRPSVRAPVLRSLGAA
jgi:hypothetical protein